jgi:proteasome lid subunit RPN8/RPN11
MKGNKNLKKNSPTLKFSNTYATPSKKDTKTSSSQEVSNLYLSQNILSKIWYLCKRINNVEWSGIIFCKTEGHPIDPETFSARAIDILPMHKGEPTYTEFEIDDRLIDAYDNNTELEECKMGIIHSHVNMGVFFSGTDTSTLNEYAKLSNFCISVIVNNKGEIIAKAAYPVSKRVTSTGVHYKDGDGNWVMSSDETSEQEVVSIKSIDMKIVLEFDEFFDKQVEVILAYKPPVTNYGYMNTEFPETPRYQSNWYNDTRQTSLFDTPSYAKSYKAKHTQDQINNFICMLIMLDNSTKISDIKGAFEKMDSKIKEIDEEIYSAMMADNLEDYYLSATGSNYMITSDTQEFIQDAMETVLNYPNFEKSDVAELVYTELANYYSDFLPHYL